MILFLRALDFKSCSTNYPVIVGILSVYSICVSCPLQNLDSYEDTVLLLLFMVHIKGIFQFKFNPWSKSP